MTRHVEISRHTALAVDATGESNRAQIAAQIVAPRMIDALKVLRAAAIVEADQRTAMRTAVLETSDFSILGTNHHHRHRANKRGAVVANIRQFGFKAEVVPDRAFEDALLLQREYVRILIDPVRNAGEASRPATANNCIHRRAPPDCWISSIVGPARVPQPEHRPKRHPRQARPPRRRWR
jgi:hypothetical protein